MTEQMQDNPLAQSMIAELKHEAAVTRTVLARVPETGFDWAPHAKSMTMGELALHVATLSGGIAQMLNVNPAQPPTGERPTAESTQALLDALDESVTRACDILESWGDAALEEEWTMMGDGKPMMVLPRKAAVRSLMLNHLYHHRGQLTVYLRLNDLPLPSVYGPTADENPFA